MLVTCLFLKQTYILFIIIENTILITDMKKELIIENLGKVLVKQNAFMGNFKLFINEKPIQKIGKTVFSVGNDNPNRIYVSGNIIKGYILIFEKSVYKITAPLPWYVYALGIVPFVMTMVLGNIAFLAEQGFYYVGGAIGGGISGAFSALTFFLCGYNNKWWQRLLICFSAICITFGICFGIGNLIALLL